MEREIKTVTLETGFKRGNDIIKSVDLRKPTTGDLRGIRLFELAQMEVDSLIKVLPRITIPSMIEAEIRQMDPADFLLLAAEVAGFLSPKQSTDFQE